MRISADDPKVTAYALDEIDERERLEFEQQLTLSPELRAAVSEVRQTAARLRNEFAAENEILCADPFPTQTILPFPRRRIWPAVTTAAAVGMVFALAWQFWFQGSRKPESSFPDATVIEPSVELRPDSEDLKRQAFDDVANIAYASAAVERHPLMADLGTGLSLDTQRFRSWPSKNAQFHFGIGYQLEF
jgi:hypothetical protein